MQPHIPPDKTVTSRILTVKCSWVQGEFLGPDIDFKVKDLNNTANVSAHSIAKNGDVRRFKFWPQLCGTMTTQPQAGSDGSQSPGPVLATQLKSEAGSTVQGKEGPALHRLSCPPWPHAWPCSGVQGLPEERTTVEGRPVGAPLLPLSLMGCCTAWLVLPSNALCKETADFLLSCHMGAAAAAFPLWSTPPTVPWKNPGPAGNARTTDRAPAGTTAQATLGWGHGRSGKPPLRSLQSLTRPKAPVLPWYTLCLLPIPSTSPSQWTYTKVTEKKIQRTWTDSWKQCNHLTNWWIMKDFNACVWQRCQNMEGRHQTHRAGKLNSTHSLLFPARVPASSLQSLTPSSA